MGAVAAVGDQRTSARPWVWHLNSGSPLVGNRSHVHWGGLLRNRAGRLDVTAARLAFAAVMSGVETPLSPIPIRGAAS